MQSQNPFKQYKGELLKETLGNLGSHRKIFVLGESNKECPGFAIDSWHFCGVQPWPYKVKW